MRSGNFGFILSLSLGMSVALAPAYSTTITYTSQASWEAATNTGYQTITFAGDTPANSGTSYDSGLTSSGVEFFGYNSSGASDLQVIDTSGSNYPWYDWGAGDALLQDMNRPNASSPLPYINIILPANVTSIGMELWTTSPQALNYVITVNGTQYTVPTYSQPTLSFWGITSDTPITSLELTLAGTTYNGSSNALMSDFSFGTEQISQVQTAPEAGAYLLIGTGLIGLVVLRKKLAPAKPDPQPSAEPVQGL